MTSAPTRLWNRAWHTGPVPHARLALLRITFYTVFAIDMWCFVPAAAQYGAGGFNASHVPWLDGMLPLPSPLAMTAVWLVCAGLAMRLAIGGAARWVGALLAALFSATVGWSLLDGYQHHVLLCELLILSACVDWRAPPAWPLRLLRVQVAIVYLWTALTKLDPLWLDGTLVAIDIGGPGPRIAAGIALILNVPVQTVWSAVGMATVGLEVALAVSLFVPRTWRVVLPLGVAFHLSFIPLGFKIGLFPVYMVVLLVVLMTPATWLPELSVRWHVPRRVWVWPLALVVAAGVALLPVPGARVAAAVLTLVGLFEWWTSGDPRRALAHGSVGVLLGVAHLIIPSARDVWAGLGETAWMTGDADRAEQAFAETLRLDPDRAAAWVTLADFEAERHRPDAALTAIGHARTLTSAPDVEARWRALADSVATGRFEIYGYYRQVCLAGDPEPCRRGPWLAAPTDPQSMAFRCEAGVWRACDQLARGADGQAAVSALSVLGVGCDAGDGTACDTLAGLQMEVGAVSSKERALELARRACDLAEPRGCYRLAHATDVADTDALHRRACDGGLADACAELATSRASRGDPAARDLAVLACRGGSPEGCQVWTSLEPSALRPP